MVDPERNDWSKHVHAKLPDFQLPVPHGSRKIKQYCDDLKTRLNDI